MKFTISVLLFSVLAFGNAMAQTIKKNIVDAHDSTSGYYLALEPEGYAENQRIDGVMVLLSGFSEHAESIFPESKLPNVAFANHILTICFAAGYRLTADSLVAAKLSTALKDVVQRYKLSPDKFVLGGYSAGGTIVLRYAELCKQYPAKYPIQPKGVFMVDAPIDMFVTWEMMENIVKENFSEPAVAEANEAIARMTNQYGTPAKNRDVYSTVTPFSRNKTYGENEKYLKDIAVRAYHDVDIAWRLVNRRQTVHNSNYELTSELIYRLLQMGNDKAEFIQSQRKGYRSNGMRHPHSWSIVDEVDCVEWAKGLMK